MEKIAYGLKLKEGISVSRIATPLVKTLEERPHALVVNDEDILRLQKLVDFPVVFFSKNSQEIDSDGINEEGTFKVFSDDMELLKTFGELRSNLQEDIDFNEPLTRATNALEHIHYNGPDSITDS